MPLSSLILLASAAHAGTAVWLTGAPDPTLTPADRARTAADVADPPVLGPDDLAAVAALEAELQSCAPLLDEFDGELAILRRLSGRVEALGVVRPEDVDLLWRALLLQGLAAHRYFPDLSATEATDAGVVRTHGEQLENAPWADAIALAPDRLPDVAELGDETARHAFQEQRARALLLESASVGVRDAPDGAVVTVDGLPAPGGSLSVVPGTHRLQVAVGGQVHLRRTLRLAPGAEEGVAYAAVTDELVAVAPVLEASKGAVVLPTAVVARLETLEAPVTLVVEAKKGPQLYRVDGENAVRIADPTDSGGSPAPHLWVAGALGWTYDGNFFVHNHAAGAPDAFGTVNALSPVVGAGAQRPLGPVHVGVGADLVVPVGDWHTVPTDDTSLRLRIHPHAAVGYGPVRATVGFWAPWHLGVGLRGAVPVSERLDLTGAVVQGLGLGWTTDSGATFEPEASRVGWVGMAWRWPG